MAETDTHIVKIAVTSRSFSRHPVLRLELLAKYLKVTFNDTGTALAGDELIAFLAGHERAIVALEHLDDHVFQALPELRVVSKYGVGLDMIDLDAMTRRGVKLGWTGGVNRRSVSELVVSLSIMLLRELPAANAALRVGSWRQPVGRQLTGRTVGIIGCGHVGSDLVTLLRPFGCRVLVHDVRDLASLCQKHDIRQVPLEHLLGEADIVTLHVPLDGTTRGMMGPDRLNLMKPGAILINTARGEIVDESALKSILQNRRLAAAAFDVFSHEPPGDVELLQLPNFFATPHLGGSAEEAILAMGRAAIAGLEQFGDPLTVAKS